MENLISSIFPTECIFCGRIGPMICYKCSLDLKVIQSGACIVCQSCSIEGKTHRACLIRGVPSSLFSCFEYEGKVRKGITWSKSPPFLYAALKVLTEHGVKYATSTGYYLFDYFLVAVPLSSKKHKKRGFNQSQVISKKLSEKLSLNTANSILIRKKDVLTQVGRGRSERLENMRNVFIADPALTKNKKILLVDDIYATGATLLSASKALYAAGAADVKCFTLSRVL